MYYSALNDLRSFCAKNIYIYVYVGVYYLKLFFIPFNYNRLNEHSDLVLTTIIKYTDRYFYIYLNLVHDICMYNSMMYAKSFYLYNYIST